MGFRLMVQVTMTSASPQAASTLSVASKATWEKSTPSAATSPAMVLAFSNAASRRCGLVTITRSMPGMQQMTPAAWQAH